MIDAILHWNQIALDAVKTDFSTADPSINPTPEQGGPTRTSRALAMVHLAMYDGYVGIIRSKKNPPYLSYATLPATTLVAGAQAAVASAACLMLINLYGRQKNTFLAAHETFVATLPLQPAAVAEGLAWVQQVAARVLAERAGDGSDASNNFYAPSPEPGKHRVDPMDPGQGFLGPLWGKVKPFGINNLTTKVPGKAPPAMTDPLYTKDYKEVLVKGSATGSTRTPNETTIGIFWAYDGPRNIGVPPRLYNQVVRTIAAKKGSSELENAKLFAMVNVAMADAGIQAWDEKYRYNLWRPVLGVREADSSWGPTGLGDGNSSTPGNPYWVPLGAPPTNQPARTPTTPHFPSYPSGHATFGTAAFSVAAAALGLKPNFKFEFVSDELDGHAVGATGVRMRQSRELTIAQAIEENVLSRVYLGVHWQFDGREGERNGAKIAKLISDNFPKMG